uniref:Uncharacterized protein n=3 Tax=Callorhinchus milii TaxID=7868 RepID=A0A4W3JUJ2_CALMI
MGSAVPGASGWVIDSRPSAQPIGSCLATDVVKVNSEMQGVHLHCKLQEVTFDLKQRDESKQAAEHDSKYPQVNHNHRPARRKEMDEKNSHFEPDVRTLISSPKWLQLHGLKRNKLTLSQILSHIGFKHKEDYVYGLRKPISSCYGEGLFQQYVRKDGR